MGSRATVNRTMPHLEVTEVNPMRDQCTFKFLIRRVASELERLIHDSDKNREQILYFFIPAISTAGWAKSTGQGFKFRE